MDEANPPGETPSAEPGDLFWKVFHGSADGFAITRLKDGRFIEVNEALASILGYSREELLGRSSLEVGLWADPGDRASLVRALRERGSVPRMETTLAAKSGELRHAEFTAQLIVFRGERCILATGHDLTDRVRAEEELRHAHEERRGLLARLVAAQEEERRTIAEDMHEDAIQKISALGIRLGTLKRDLTDPEHVRLLGQAEEAVKASIEGLRRLVFELRPPALDRQGLAEALRMYVERTWDRPGLDLSIEDRTGVDPPAETRAILYRIAQEALSNARKHARAGRVEVFLERRNDGIFVRVADDGVGLDPGPAGEHRPGFLGISAMRERAEMAGGWCVVASSPGHGTRVEFWVPSEASV